MKKLALFVTGTDTGVGKTHVTVGLLRAFGQLGLSTAGMKPVATGACITDDGLRNDDALQLQDAATQRLEYDKVNPYVFVPPIAPHIAAARSGVVIDPGRIAGEVEKLCEQADVVLVEGAGGWHVPLDDKHMIGAIAAIGGLDVLLVVGMRLGCINHALLTAAAIAADGARLSGWIANSPDRSYDTRADTIETLRHRIAAPLLAQTGPLSPGRDPGEDFMPAARQLAAEAGLISGPDRAYAKRQKKLK